MKQPSDTVLQSPGIPEVTCTQCGVTVTGTYCSNCGQETAVKRITLHSLVHDVFHFFTHLDKGFLFTLKQLLISPGTMQREYVSGIRSRHQKPFSMFFICASASALIYLQVNRLLITYYHSSAPEDAAYFQTYMVLVQVCLIPFYTLFTWLAFRGSKVNYAETAVQLLYSFSVILLLAATLQLLRFIWPDLETRYIEFPVLTAYIFITNLRFYAGRRWIIFIRSVLATAACFIMAGAIQDAFVQYLTGK